MVNRIPSFPDSFRMLSIGEHNVPEHTGRRILHVGATVEFDTANVLISNPHVYMGWFEGILSSIDHKLKLPFKSYCRYSDNSFIG